MTEQKPLSIDEYKLELEASLDKHFPKGECKERGAALVLFADAVLMAKRLHMEVSTVDLSQRDAQKIGKQLQYVAGGDRITTTDPEGKEVVFNIRPNRKGL